MTGFNTQLETMDTAAKRVDDVNVEIGRLLSRVHGSVGGLGAGVWQGTAQVRFTQIMAEWQEQSTKLNNALSGISETMRSNSSSFNAADQDSASLISRAGAAGPLNI